MREPKVLKITRLLTSETTEAAEDRTSRVDVDRVSLDLERVVRNKLSKGILIFLGNQSVDNSSSHQLQQPQKKSRKGSTDNNACILLYVHTGHKGYNDTTDHRTKW